MRRRCKINPGPKAHRDTTSIRVNRLPGRPLHQGLLRFRGLTIPCSLGRNGIKTDKREGDGATPTGMFRMQNLWYRPELRGRPRTLFPGIPIKPFSGWCDDPSSPAYNRPVRLPFGASHERLWRSDPLYDLVVVLDHNVIPRRKGRGSAIFFHLQRDDRGPTEGCVAIPFASMRRLLPRLPRRCWMIIR